MESQQMVLDTVKAVYNIVPNAMMVWVVFHVKLDINCQQTINASVQKITLSTQKMNVWLVN
jgi:hypothetical protein